MRVLSDDGDLQMGAVQLQGEAIMTSCPQSRVVFHV